MTHGNPHHYPAGFTIDGKNVGGKFATVAHGESAGFTEPRYTNVRFDHPWPEHVKEVARTLNAHGHELMVVGGSVRDAISGQNPHDYDLASSANPDELKKIYAGKYNTDVRGESHGTIRIPAPDGGQMEITSYRVDENPNGRHATTKYVRDFVQDSRRRDTTATSLGVNPLTGEVVGPGEGGDPRGAIADIRNKIVRINSHHGDNGEQTIRDDKLRAIRAVRFSSAPGWSLAPESAQAIRNTVDDVETAYHLPQEDEGKLSHDRFKDEMIKAFGYKTGGVFPRRLHELKNSNGKSLLDVFHPELTKLEKQGQNIHHDDNVLEHTLKVVEGVGGKDKHDTTVNRVAALFHDAGKAPDDYIVNGKRIAHGTAKLTDKVVNGVPYGHSFHGHEEQSGNIADSVLTKFNYPNTIKDEHGIDRPFKPEILNRIRGHMAIPKEDASDKTWRTWIRKVEPPNVEGNLSLRASDYNSKQGANYPAEQVRQRVNKLMQESPPPARLALDGNDIQRIVGKTAGPWMRGTIEQLKDFVDENPGKNNTQEALTGRLMELKHTIDKK